MKKTYISPAVESIKYSSMLMSSSAPTSLNDNVQDAVFSSSVLSKDGDKDKDFWD
ncbi:MAG: hypothetical protein J1F13_02765 [Prevotellaceae bacterium]|nr:hypothetical protein [Prevotellaceae bacterium]